MATAEFKQKKVDVRFRMYRDLLVKYMGPQRGRVFALDLPCNPMFVDAGGIRVYTDNEVAGLGYVMTRVH